MKLAELQIHNFRNIHSARFSLHPRINVITGVNGSGKTSFLEAIYLLGSGRSFRTREITALVTHDLSQLNVFARTNDSQTISVQKSLQNPTIARLNNQACFSSSELAAFLPCQVFYQDVFQIIDAGPVHRRALLDWGLFHVEPNYLFIWKEYKRALKQRNALLKQQAAQPQLYPWNILLSDLALQLDALRAEYFVKLNLTFMKVLAELTEVKCILTYYKGWDRRNEGKLLKDILSESYSSDLQRQYTYYGPHQADLIVESKDYKVKNYLSRGQQKIILFALKLAQVGLTEKSCVFLIDDMTSELDERHIQRLLNYIYAINGQVFITSQTDEFLGSSSIKVEAKTFKLQNGEIITP